MSKSKIEWTEKTWNPVTGCTKVSKGCENCYAEREWSRMAGNPKTVYHGRKFADVQCHDDRVDQPLRWKKPRRVFVNSMSDLFHPDVSFEFIDRVFAIMALCPQHKFQILTKRPERMREYFTDVCEQGRLPDCREAKIGGLVVKKAHSLGEEVRKINWDIFFEWPLPNVWMGVSVEDQKTADERIPILLETPAATRFVSYEPALGPVEFSKWCLQNPEPDQLFVPCVDHLPPNFENEPDPENCKGCLEAWEDAKKSSAELYSENIDWIIMGGESGPNARPMALYWARSVRDQCQEAGVPFFFKQWGEWVSSAEIGFGGFENKPTQIMAPYEMMRVGKKIAGRSLDGKLHDEFPK